MTTDPTAYVGAVTRVVENRERDGRPARAVIAARNYDTDIADLWDALTNAERIPRWFMPVSGELRLGGRYQLHGNAGGTITQCEPPKRLAVTWEFGGGISWVTVTLSRVSAKSTRLELEHVAPIDSHWKQYGPGAVGVGWDLGLYGLARHIETGEAVAQGEGLTFLGTSAGKTFVTASSADWGHADIVAGEDPAVAKAAAENTRAAYTGGGDPG